MARSKQSSSTVDTTLTFSGDETHKASPVFTFSVAHSQRQGFTVNGVSLATAKISDILCGIATADRWGVFTPTSNARFALNGSQFTTVEFSEIPEGYTVLDVLVERVQLVRDQVDSFMASLGKVRSFIQILVIQTDAPIAQDNIIEQVTEQFPNISPDDVAEVISSLISEAKVIANGDGSISLTTW